MISFKVYGIRIETTESKYRKAIEELKAMQSIKAEIIGGGNNGLSC